MTVPGRRVRLQKIFVHAGHFVHCLALLCLCVNGAVITANANICPPPETIMPCRCSMIEHQVQIWCSHSNLLKITEGIKALERHIKFPIDEFVLENNQLPSLSGRFFGSLQIVRLMLRYNGLERLSTGWLNDLETSLVELFVVEPQLRGIPVESLTGMENIVAITIHCDELKHLPDFSGLPSLTHLSVRSRSLTDIHPYMFRHLPKALNLQLNGGDHVNRLDMAIFEHLMAAKNVDLSHNRINWINYHVQRYVPNVISLRLSHNQISDIKIIGIVIKDLKHLQLLHIDHNSIKQLEEGSFVDLPHIIELDLSDNLISDIQYGAFLRTPMLKTVHLQRNHINRIHSGSFLLASGSGVETVHLYENHIDNIGEVRALFEALPALKFLDISNNMLRQIPAGAIRGHGNIEQLFINSNHIHQIERDAFMSMPALRELRMRNNSLSSEQMMPFWNLPNLMGLDLALNQFQRINSSLLAGLPFLRRLDLSGNHLISLDPATFLYNPMIETLNISYNKLSSVHSKTFHNLNRLFEIDLSRNKLKDFIPRLPKVVERVSLCCNYITQLTDSNSSYLNLPNLRMLDLSYNLLEIIPKFSFQDTPQLRFLSMSGNRLRTINHQTFVGLDLIELLLLQNNGIAEIHPHAFAMLTQMRYLNLQRNKLQHISDALLSNNTLLEHLDMSQNNLQTFSSNALRSQQLLEYFDLSNNALSEVPRTLAALANLRYLDLSFNHITHIEPNVIGAWLNAIEIRLSNNAITELKHSTFHNLPHLQYLDISSNEISIIESGAISELPNLQELILADNKLVKLNANVFENLPMLFAVHFQYNNMRFISPDSFYNTTSVVFLNLSNNEIGNLENIGIDRMRNLEVLDLSANRIRTISTMPLKELHWLVELKMDNNDICKVIGLPFDTMPRLRVLSIRNNRLHSMPERTFQHLRSNMAMLDMEGNPIVCSCETQWLTVWLQETNFPYPGPKCMDGRLLRASRIDKSFCESHSLDQQKDTGKSVLSEDTNDDCRLYEGLPSGRPLVAGSPYFYDEYVDYDVQNRNSSSSPSTTTQPTRGHPNNYNIHENININNTILNANYPKKHPDAYGISESSSPFTFFGYPLDTSSINRFLGFGRPDKKHATANSKIGRSEHMTRKTHIYQPEKTAIEKLLNQDTHIQDGQSRSKWIQSAYSHEMPEPEKSVENIGPGHPHSNGQILRGGFRPIIPEQIGGFVPIHNPVNHQATTPRFLKIDIPLAMRTHQNSSVFKTSVQHETVPDEGTHRLLTASATTVRATTATTTTVTAPTTTMQRDQIEPTANPRRATTSIVPTSKTTIPTAIAAEEAGATGSTPSPAGIVQSQHQQPPQEVPFSTPLTNRMETILLIPPSATDMDQLETMAESVATTTSDGSVYKDNEDFATGHGPTDATAIGRAHSSAPTRGRSSVAKVFMSKPYTNQFRNIIDEQQISSPDSFHDEQQWDHGRVRAEPTESAHNYEAYEQTPKSDDMDWYYETFKGPIGGRISKNYHHAEQAFINKCSSCMHLSLGALQFILLMGLLHSIIF